MEVDDVSDVESDVAPHLISVHARLNSDIKSRICNKYMITCHLPQENLILLHANNQCADQPAHLRSLISVSVIRLTKCLMTPLAIILSSLCSWTC